MFSQLSHGSDFWAETQGEWKLNKKGSFGVRGYFNSSLEIAREVKMLASHSLLREEKGEGSVTLDTTVCDLCDIEK